MREQAGPAKQGSLWCEHTDSRAACQTAESSKSAGLLQPSLQASTISENARGALLGGHASHEAGMPHLNRLDLAPTTAVGGSDGLIAENSSARRLRCRHG